MNCATSIADIMQVGWTRERIAAFQELKPELLDIFKLQPVDTAIWFEVRQYISGAAVCDVQRDGTSDDVKAYALLKHLVGRENGWSGLIAFLGQQCHLAIKQQLLNAEVRLLSYGGNEIAGQKRKWKPDHDFSDAFIHFLRDWTLNECETIRELWGKLLHTQGLAEAFVRLNFAEEITKTHYKLDELDNYEFLYGPEKRIVISGDPGMGKSTLINKIAYDWASDTNKKLSSRFQYVFILRCGRLTQQMTLESELQRILGEKYKQAINTCISQLETQILLLLDGFDEKRENDDCHWLDEFIHLKRYMDVKCVITTRPSHVDLIARKHLWLCVQGFGSNEQKDFLQKQLVAEKDAKFILDKFHSLPTLAQRPFFLTIVCVLARHWQQNGQKFKPSPASALFELMKAYHAWLFYTHVQEEKLDISRAEFDDVMVQAGSFAYSEIFVQQCRRETKLPDINVPALTDQEKERATKVGLLSVDRRTTCSGTPGISNHVFLHQLFAEYVCAVFLAQLLEQKLIQERLKLLNELTCCLNLSESPVSYFLSALSRDYLTAAVSAALKSNNNLNFYTLYIPWVADCRDPDLDQLVIRMKPWDLSCSYRIVSSKLLLQIISFGVADSYIIAEASLDERWFTLLPLISDDLTFANCILPAPISLDECNVFSMRELSFYNCEIESFSFLRKGLPQRLSITDGREQSDIYRELAVELEQLHATTAPLNKLELNIAGKSYWGKVVPRPNICDLLHVVARCHLNTLILIAVELLPTDLEQLCTGVKRLKLTECSIIDPTEDNPRSCVDLPELRDASMSASLHDGFCFTQELELHGCKLNSFSFLRKGLPQRLSIVREKPDIYRKQAERTRDHCCT